MTAFTARASLLLSLAAATALTGSTLAAPAWAAGPSAQTRAAALQALADCRAVADGAQRLVCYDKAAATLDQAEAKGDIVIVDREQARAVRKQAFGFTLPSLSILGGGRKDEDIDNVTSKVSAARAAANGKWTIRLEDGAVWTQIDSTEVTITPRAGMAVRVRRASMGSYLMILPNQPAIRVRREE